MINKAKQISLMDLTSLNSKDTNLVIDALCKKAVTPLGNVAAVCVFSQFINLAKTQLHNKNIPVATVANFPLGSTGLQATLTEVAISLAMGADEIDVVIPYQDYLAGNKSTTQTLVKKCKQLCHKRILKVILETGVLTSDAIIYDASCRVLEAGADFIKTSTGKSTVGATLKAARQMLNAIKAINPVAGFKVSGGIKTPEQAQDYLDLAQEIMGESWCTAQHVRIGASSLLDALLQ